MSQRKEVRLICSEDLNGVSRFIPSSYIYLLVTCAIPWYSRTNNARKTVDDLVESRAKLTRLPACKICCPKMSFNH